MLIVTGAVSFRPGFTETIIVRLLAFIEIAFATAVRSGVGPTSSFFPGSVVPRLPAFVAGGGATTGFGGGGDGTQTVHTPPSHICCPDTPFAEQPRVVPF